ncbi:MAG: putative transcriptional regulatory protein [Patescibacteria group bacterium]|nr:putative transcriptional regulatory protein [Patescibacteria group bacterium]
MSGHSKWAKVKYQKAQKDPKRGQAFSKLSNLITVASRNGTDIETNPKLRLAVEKARELGMPKENIERAISRGSGNGTEGKQLEELMCEAYGPGGTAILIQAITDNKNRTLAELRHLLQNYDAKPANSGSVSYLFKETGRITLPKNFWNDDLALKIIELGAEEIKENKDTVEIYTSPNNLTKLKNFLEENYPEISLEAAIDFISQQPVIISKEDIKNKLEALFNALDEHPDVEEIYSNAEY